MTNRTQQTSFVSSCLILSILFLFTAAVALAVYFVCPVDKASKTPIVEVAQVEEDTAPEVEEAADFEFEISEAFQEYLADISYFNLSDKSDNGLTYYRQSASRATVEWFYTHITGSRDIAQAILTEADNNDIPLSLAFALAYTESRYNTKAVHKNTNSTYDRGLFQLNSNTFTKLTEADFFDPFISAKYGMSHLRFCLNTAGNEVSALAMYNAGTNRVRSNSTPQTTLNYVGNIMAYQKMLDNLFTQEVVSYFENDFVQGITVAYNATDKQ